MYQTNSNLRLVYLPKLRSQVVAVCCHRPMWHLDRPLLRMRTDAIAVRQEEFTSFLLGLLVPSFTAIQANIYSYIFIYPLSSTVCLYGIRDQYSQENSGSGYLPE